MSTYVCNQHSRVIYFLKHKVLNDIFEHIFFLTCYKQLPFLHDRVPERRFNISK